MKRSTRKLRSAHVLAPNMWLCCCDAHVSNSTSTHITNTITQVNNALAKLIILVNLSLCWGACFFLFRLLLFQCYMTSVYPFITVPVRHSLSFGGEREWRIVSTKWFFFWIAIWKSMWSGCLAYGAVAWSKRKIWNNSFSTTNFGNILGLKLYTNKHCFYFCFVCGTKWSLKVLKLKCHQLDADAYDLNAFHILNTLLERLNQRTERKSGCQTIYFDIHSGVSV